MEMKRFQVFFHVNPRVPKANIAYVEAESERQASALVRLLVAQNVEAVQRSGFVVASVEEDTTPSLAKALTALP